MYCPDQIPTQPLVLRRRHSSRATHRRAATVLNRPALAIAAAGVLAAAHLTGGTMYAATATHLAECRKRAGKRLRTVTVRLAGLQVTGRAQAGRQMARVSPCS